MKQHHALKLFVVDGQHSGGVYTSRFSLDDVNGHLDRLLLPRGDPWWTRFRQCLQPVEEYQGLLDMSTALGRSADIFGHLYPVQRRSFVFSSLILAFLLLTVSATGLGGRYYKIKPRSAVTTLITPSDILLPKLRAGKISRGQGGGGAREPLPASKGRLPKAAPRQFVPPAVEPPVEAKLVIEPTLVAPQVLVLPKVDLSMFGDPLAAISPPSNGPGSGGGIGAGIGGGVGAGIGPAYPAAKKVAGIVAGGGVIPPRAIKSAQPQYTAEAYQAKLEGKVILQVLVLIDGTARVVRVISGQPMGLTEKAMEAVKKSTFEAGRRNGQPIAMEAQITIFFRL